MRITATFVFCFLPVAHAFALSNDAVIGRWYTEGVENGLYAQSIWTNNADGTFVKTLIDSTDCKSPKTWVETGTWKLQGEQINTVTKTVGADYVDYAQPDYNDTFDVTSTDQDHIAFFDVKTKITWPMGRVPAAFVIPPSNHCATS